MCSVGVLFVVVMAVLVDNVNQSILTKCFRALLWNEHSIERKRRTTLKLPFYSIVTY